jgi:hypothetical protein
MGRSYDGTEIGVKLSDESRYYGGKWKVIN